MSVEFECECSDDSYVDIDDYCTRCQGVWTPTHARLLKERQAKALAANTAKLKQRVSRGR